MALIEHVARWWASVRGRRYGLSMSTATGAKFWPLDPRASEVDLADVARGLACRCRYQGQIGIGTGYQYYSVAEHSVIVSQFVETLALERGVDPYTARYWAKLALLHDGSEAYIADVARPLKYSREMSGYRRIEERVQAAVYEAFEIRITPEAHKMIREVDNRILTDEMSAFMNSDDDAVLAAKYGEPLGAAIAGLAPYHAEQVFVRRYLELFTARYHELI